MSSFGVFKLPAAKNEPNQHYAPGSKERAALDAAVKKTASTAPFHVPALIGGKEVYAGGEKLKQPMPHDHKRALATYEATTPELASKAADAAVAAKGKWESLPFNERAAVFLRAADLISTTYRYDLCAATMLGQGKNVWQAEIDAAAEIADFLRFGVSQAEQLYATQPTENAALSWNRLEYRALEGFVLAVSPFNFTAIAGNLTFVPVILGNAVVWKPSPTAVYSSWLVLQVFIEAGMPADLVQFLPVPNGPPTVNLVNTLIERRDFAGLHFTGSTFVFRELWKKIAANLDKYISYPRIVGETGGKNFQLVHGSADVEAAVIGAIRGAFEYQGQKCSALSRLYVAESIWPQFRETLLAHLKRIKVGSIEDFENFMGPVISKASFDKSLGYTKKAVEEGAELLYGGTGDDSTGFFVQPTVLVSKNPKISSFVDEIFGPVLSAYVFPDAKLDETCDLIEATTPYALTGAIFAKDRLAVAHLTNKLRYASGMFYINDKSTGAVVGQQPFGGGRASGTNDKAGSGSIFYKFVNTRTIKENFVPPHDFLYPHNAKL